jgi:hypothetical protein
VIGTAQLSLCEDGTYMRRGGLEPNGPRSSMSASMQTRARTALAERLRRNVPAGALHPAGEHTLRFADALVPTLTADDVSWAHAELARGAKGELRPARSGAIQAHAAWSSTALVCSAFAPWRTEPSALTVAGLGGFTEVRLEERLHIPHGGGTPNLDVALEGPSGLVGIESKLTEHLAPRTPRGWSAPYRRPAMLAALDGGWAAVFADLLAGRWAPRFLDAGQLVRHALSLRRLGARAQLVLLVWEPLEGDALPEVAAHRAEVAELLERVGDAVPRLHAQPFSALLADWSATRPEHVAALRARYDVAVTTPPRRASRT